MDPLLLRRRSGRTAALVIASLFGGGTLLLGVGGAILSREPGAVLPALAGYGMATAPIFLFAAVVAVCRTELWLLPEERVLRQLTFRPWLRRPRVEQAPVSEYAGVTLDPAPEDEGGGVMVSLVTTAGESVALQQFQALGEAQSYAGRIADAVGFWLRGHGGPEPS